MKTEGKRARTLPALSAKVLPAYGRELLELRRCGLVPANDRGIAENIFVVIDDWKMCAHRRFRVVVSEESDPAGLEWCFVAGLDVFCVWSMTRTSTERRDAVLRGLARAAPRFLFVVDWDAPEHGFMIISRRDGVLRPEYCR